MKQRLFITGGAGYVGAMLADQFSAREDVEAILLIDKEPETELTKNTAHKDKISYIQDNLGNTETESSWIKQVRDFAPTAIIHTAWQIRDIYGNLPLQRKWNIDGSNHVFDLVFTLPSVHRLVYFSTVASYGAFPDNSIDYRYKETDPFRVTDYNYAEEKRMVEENLEKRYEEAKSSGWHGQVYLVRPAAITGPRGRIDRVRFGLQSALSGTLKGKSFIYSVISALVSWVPVTPKWLRQYIHEDDVNDIVELLTFQHEVRGDIYEAFNICPPGDVVLVYQDVLKKMPMRGIGHFWFFESVHLNIQAYEAAKRIIDIAVALPVLLFYMPFVPFIYLAIKLDDKGPLLSIQKRYGRGGKIVNIYKIRTMDFTDEGEWVTQNKNNKVTRVGAFLRKSRLDEFPQLINVLIGDVSLVGPRSDILANGGKLSAEIPYYMMRYTIVPGLSGWAQVNQELPPNSLEETKVRLQYDLYYVKNRSLLLDFIIMIKTFRVLVLRTGI